MPRQILAKSRTDEAHMTGFAICQQLHLIISNAEILLVPADSLLEIMRNVVVMPKSSLGCSFSLESPLPSPASQS